MPVNGVVKQPTYAPRTVPPAQRRQLTPEEFKNDLKNNFSKWQQTIQGLPSQGIPGGQELQQIVNDLKNSDIAKAMNKAYDAYKLAGQGIKTAYNLAKDPYGLALEVGMDMLSVLLQPDPAKRGDAATEVLKKWFPWFDWNGPPPVWKTASGEYVNRTSSNTDYAGRPLPGFFDPLGKLVTWQGPGGR